MHSFTYTCTHMLTHTPQCELKILPLSMRSIILYSLGKVCGGLELWEVGGGSCLAPEGVRPLPLEMFTVLI